MPAVIAHHDVKDEDHSPLSPKREEVFGPLGVTRTPDADVRVVAVQSEALGDGMVYDGVLGEALAPLVDP